MSAVFADAGRHGEGPLARLFAEATTLEQAGRFAEAETLLRQALQIAPEHPHAIHMMGIVAFRSGNEEEACRLMERSIALSPNTGLYYRNICAIYRALGRLEAARAAGLRAVSLTPEDPHAHANLAIVHYDLLELDEAFACCERALTLKPDYPEAHFEKAEIQLLRGDYEAGWEEYEWRFQLPQAAGMLPKTEKPQWDGAPIAEGRLLLVADQGFGDVIQFSRYIPWAATRCRELLIAGSSELKPILSQFSELRGIYNRWDEIPEYVAYCPLSSLPRLAGTRPETIPAPIPYLRADLARTAAWAARLNDLLPKGFFRVAIAWAGRPAHNNDRNRSSSLPQWQAILATEGVAFLALQKGVACKQVGEFFGDAALYSLGPSVTDFADTMAILDCVDLVISVDTSLAHLAGAMGRPVWVMLPFAPDWRWLLQRADTPWYPSMRLYRQHAPRDWEELTARVAADLLRHVTEQEQAESPQWKMSA
jgi:thioredoxin-like negative regulator of GroEL